MSDDRLAEIEHHAYGESTGKYYGPSQRQFEWLIAEVKRLRQNEEAMLTTMEGMQLEHRQELRDSQKRSSQSDDQHRQRDRQLDEPTT